MDGGVLSPFMIGVELRLVKVKAELLCGKNAHHFSSNIVAGGGPTGTD